MAKHIDTGKKGEEIAVRHLQKLGFRILETNWRHGRLEVDIIAMDGEVLVFVEVKTRSYDYYGEPSSFVDRKKERHLARAASIYMAHSGHQWAIRFDVVSVLLNSGKSWNVKHLKDAFYPGLEY